MRINRAEDGHAVGALLASMSILPSVTGLARMCVAWDPHKFLRMAIYCPLV
jgi:hypothetical protein